MGCIGRYVFSIIILLSSWGPTNKTSSDVKDYTAATVEVEDAEVAQDNMITRGSEEESSSSQQMVVESVNHDTVSNVKNSSLHHSKDNDKLLETPTVPFDSVSSLLKKVSNNY